MAKYLLIFSLLIILHVLCESTLAAVGIFLDYFMYGEFKDFGVDFGGSYISY